MLEMYLSALSVSLIAKPRACNRVTRSEAVLYGFEYGTKEMPIKVNESDKPVWSNLRKSYHIIGGDKDEMLTFKGKASGSGSGLSVWGARGMANADETTTYKNILAHYYPGTKLVK